MKVPVNVLIVVVACGTSAILLECVACTNSDDSDQTSTPYRQPRQRKQNVTRSEQNVGRGGNRVLVLCPSVDLHKLVAGVFRARHSCRLSPGQAN